MANGLQGMRDKYNTEIPEDLRDEFMRWVGAETQRRGKNPLDMLYDFDVQGFWLSGEWRTRDFNSLYNDRWKKPNHPTFSNESRYHGADEYYGGQWGSQDEKSTFSPSRTNINFHGENGLYRYFRENLGGAILKAESPSSPYPPKDNSILNLDGSPKE